MYCLEWSYSYHWFRSRYHWKNSCKQIIIKEHLCCVSLSRFILIIKYANLRSIFFSSGLHWGAYTKNEPARIAEVWSDLFELFESGKLQPALYEKVYTIDTIAEGLKAINDRVSYAKVVAKIGNNNSKI